MGILRGVAGRNPYDKGLSDLVGELSTRRAKRIDHPVVGRLELMYDTLHLPADAGLTVLVHTAAPGSRTEDALRLLASWAATQDASRADAPSAG